MKEIFEILDNYGWVIYLLFISMLAFGLTCYDKIAAKKLPAHRIPERTLLAVSALGGSVVMLLTMLTIRHKTKHVKFMLGIPLIILAQAAAVFFALRYGIIGF